MSPGHFAGKPAPRRAPRPAPLRLQPQAATWFPGRARLARQATWRVGGVDVGRVWALKDNKKARGALVALALVALAFLVSLVLS